MASDTNICTTLSNNTQTKESSCSGITFLDPVEGLVEYVKFVKPYHTKIIDVLVEYVHEDFLDVIINEDHDFCIENFRPEQRAPLYTSNPIIGTDDKGNLIYHMDDNLCPYSEISSNQPQFSCDNGFGLSPFGGTIQWPVVSPHNEISELTQPNHFYDNRPAFDVSNSSLTILGDRSNEFKAGDQVYINTYIEDFGYQYKIVGIGPGSAGTGYFDIKPLSFVNRLVDDYGFIYQLPDEFDDYSTILTSPSQQEDFGLITELPPSHFINIFGINDKFYTVGTESDDNKEFVITDIVQHTGFVRVYVNKAVISKHSYGRLGLRRIPVLSNSGIFELSNVSTEGGSVDSWSGYPDPSTYTLGTSEHTRLSVSPPLSPVFYDNEYKTLVIRVSQHSLPIEQVLSYSNYKPNLLTNNNVEQSPSEGITYFEISGVLPSIVDITGSVVPDSGKFTVQGNIEQHNIFIGDIFDVVQSNYNNGTYTITSINYDSNNNVTEIGTNEQIRNSNVDGMVKIVVPSNVFVVDGNHTERFSQGKEFKVTGGTFSGEYTTLTSTFNNGKTRIRPIEEIIDVDNEGFDIHSISSNGFEINGNLYSKFKIGDSFNVYGTDTNDGSYTIADIHEGSVIGGNATSMYITPNEQFNEDNECTGKLVHSVMGNITDSLFGFGETKDMCVMNPEGLARVVFKEQLQFDGIGIDARDNIIAYNFENTDRIGFSLPFNTIISSLQPTITSSVTPPTSPNFDQLWFNTGLPNTNQYKHLQLYRWSGFTWVEHTTVYWLDTNENILYYRIKDKIIDTNWVVFLAEPPGMNAAQSAVGSMQLIGKESFHVTSDSNNCVQSTFTFRHIQSPIIDVLPETVSTLGYFVVDGDLQEQLSGINISQGMRKMYVTDSINNDGEYQVARFEYNLQLDQTTIFVHDAITNSTISGNINFGPLTIPLVGSIPDRSLVKVLINKIPANFDIDNQHQITLKPNPLWKINDLIEVCVYDRNRQETNAWVENYDAEPHTVFHQNVEKYEDKNAYILYGGNWVHRFGPSTKWKTHYTDRVLILPEETNCEDYGLVTLAHTEQEDYGQVIFLHTHSDEYGYVYEYSGCTIAFCNDYGLITEIHDEQEDYENINNIHEFEEIFGLITTPSNCDGISENFDDIVSGCEDYGIVTMLHDSEDNYGTILTPPDLNYNYGSVIQTIDCITYTGSPVILPGDLVGDCIDHGRVEEDEQ